MDYTYLGLQSQGKKKIRNTDFERKWITLIKGLKDDKIIKSNLIFLGGSYSGNYIAL